MLKSIRAQYQKSSISKRKCEYSKIKNIRSIWEWGITTNHFNFVTGSLFSSELPIGFICAAGI